jgi:hypothetical protein
VFWLLVLLALLALAALAALGLTLLAASSVCLCARELARSLCARARAHTFPPSSCPPRARPQTWSSAHATLASTGAAVVATLAAVALPAAGLLAFALPFGACLAAVAVAAPAVTPELDDTPGNKTIFVEGAMQIFVRVQTGRTITLAVNLSENVLG